MELGSHVCAMEAEGQANTKTRERTEGAVTAVQAMRGDGFSARRVEPGPNTKLSEPFLFH